MSMLDYSDTAYFEECLLEQANLWVPVTLKRCVAITRDSDYPDDPAKFEYSLDDFLADIREVSLQEAAFSGGSLIVGDNVIWCQKQLRGPRDLSDEEDNPDAIADILIIHNGEWTVIGQPLVGRLREPGIIGCQAYIRRRRGGQINVTDPGYDDDYPQV